MLPIASDSVLGTMVTPAVLIAAAGTLILSTSNRLGRVVSRVRELSRFVEELSAQDRKDKVVRKKLEGVFEQLGRQSRRATLIQKSLTAFYISVGFFVATSFAMGVMLASHQEDWLWVAAMTGLLGAGLLLYGCVLLITEAQLALKTLRLEMAFIQDLGRMYLPADFFEKTTPIETE